MKLKTTLLTLVTITNLFFGTTNAQNECEGNWLTTSGNKLLDANGEEVILAGVNWFGFETQVSVFHGLYARDYKGVLQQVKNMGFNCIRIPWHNGIMRTSATYQEANYWVKDPVSFTGTSEQAGPHSNLDLQGLKSPLEVLDLVIEWCQKNDLKVILDNHSRVNDAYLTEKLWFTETFSEDEWIADWISMTERYKEFDAVIAMDINNEPNGKIDNPEGSKWGTGNKYDWRLAAERCGNAILKVNPNVLIMVEGIEAYKKPSGENTSYWWGGNLQGVRDYPVRLDIPSKLVYSPHEYGPTVFEQTWFKAANFPDNMEGIWEEQFNFINTQEISPLFVGELGIRDRDGIDEVWFNKFVEFIKKKKLHFTFWSLNPNSGDTGGLLENDWITPVQWKLDYLKPILSTVIPNCSAAKILSTTDLIKNKKIKINVYPNPTSKDLVISADHNLESFVIYDVTGKNVLERSDIGKPKFATTISNLKTGLYILKIITQKEVYTVKLTKI